jgi:tRNA(fMet)-specific endonuclease VapC
LNRHAIRSMNYLLDTCVVSDFAQGHSGVVARIKATTPDEIAVSVLTEMEVDYGLQLNPKLSLRLKPVMDAFFGAVHLLPYDSVCAQRTARLRAALKARGSPIGAYDALLAGTALAQGLILVTSNLREFERVDGLVVEDWRQ